MSKGKATTMERKESRGPSSAAEAEERSDMMSPPPPGGGDFDEGGPDESGPSRPPSGPGRPATFGQYKPEQGKNTRLGTFIAIGLLVAWGAYFLYERLQVYQGDEWTSLLITTGIPILFGVIFGTLAWWVTYCNRGTGDFMIATEGEMKKVSWSTRREVIGSTKVVILFTILLAAFLFIVDIVFQMAFEAMGVLRR